MKLITSNLKISDGETEFSCEERNIVAVHGLRCFVDKPLQLGESTRNSVNIGELNKVLWHDSSNGESDICLSFSKIVDDAYNLADNCEENRKTLQSLVHKTTHLRVE